MKPEQGGESGGYKTVAGEATRFFAVGLLATGVHLAVGLAIVHFVHGTILTANLGGYLTAFLVSYLGHTTFSFRTDYSSVRFIRFLVLNTLLFVLALLISWLLDAYQVNRYVGVFLTVCVLPPLSFLIHKFVTFR